MIKKLFILLSCISLSLSCSDRNQIEKELKILQSKPITIPMDIETLLDGRDTMINNLMKSELKLVVYTDSLACSTCEISKMEEWMGLINYASAFDNRLKFYFIFAPSKQDERIVRIKLKMNYFDYPMFLDSDGKFDELNPHLPKNKAMHTFLLDKNNNVILVGNPLKNNNIMEMFTRMTTERLKN